MTQISCKPFGVVPWILQVILNRWCYLKFLDLYQAKDVTPYMHASYAHVPEFLKLYQNLAYYTQQGMEKYNDTVWKDYFRSSNHRGVSALKQLFMIKQNTAFGSGCCGKGERKLQLWTLFNYWPYHQNMYCKMQQMWCSYFLCTSQ